MSVVPAPNDSSEGFGSENEKNRLLRVLGLCILLTIELLLKLEVKRSVSI